MTNFSIAIKYFNLNPSFSIIDLKSKYRKLLYQWHPDVSSLRGIKPELAKTETQKIISYFEILKENIPDETFIKSQENSKPRPKNEYYNSPNKKQYDYSVDSIDLSFDNRIILKSSNIKWVSYFQDVEILSVKFRGDISFYIYYDVTKLTFEELLNSESHGKFLNRVIKHKNIYDRIDDYESWLKLYLKLSKYIEEQIK